MIRNMYVEYIQYSIIHAKTNGEGIHYIHPPPGHYGYRISFQLPYRRYILCTYSSFLFLALRHEPFFALIERGRESYSDSVIRFNGNENTFEAMS